jgi:microcystin-dependent protein
VPDPGQSVAGWQPPLYRFGGLGVAPTVAHSDVFTTSLPSALAGPGVATTAARSDALSATGSLPIIGEIRMYGVASNPTGWLQCDGSTVSRTTYAALFAVIGTTWGSGDGSTTFNLPDLRGRSPIGDGTGTYSGATAHPLSQVIGEETHTLTMAEMPSHNHSFSPTVNAGGGAPVITEGTPGVGTDSTAIANTGGGGAHNTYQPVAAVRFIIKT